MPPPIKPMLGDLELSLVQWVETVEEQVVVDHAVPGLEGNYSQRLNRSSTQIRLQGVISGDRALEAVESLRQKFHDGQPLPFVADILTATRVQQVLIGDLWVQEAAGLSDRFVYRLNLKEYIPPPPPEVEVDEGLAEEAGQEAEEQVNGVSDGLGDLEVQVNLAEGADYSRIAVQVEGETADGEPFSTVIEEQTGGIYRLQGLRSGSYTVRVVSR